MPNGAWFILGQISVIGAYLSAVVVGLGLPLIKNINVFFRETVLLISLWRHIASHIIHFTLAFLLIADTMAFKQVMLESIMPPATANAVLAYVYGFDVETAFKAIIVSTVFSLTEIFAFIWLRII